jgi:hypothetical protein
MLAKNPDSIHSMIAWLETKDPDACYDYKDSFHCLNTQYLEFHGLDYGDERTWDVPLWHRLHHGDFRYIAEGRGHEDEWTFGKALARARERAQ